MKWLVGEGVEPNIVQDDGDDNVKVVCDRVSDIDGNGGRSNAALMAAAPALLSALENLLDAPAFTAEWAEARKQARAVIAQVQSGEPK